MRIRLACVAFLSLLMFTLGCEVLQEGLISPDETNQWVGTWGIDTVNGRSVVETFAGEHIDAPSLIGHGWLSFYDERTWDGYVELSFREEGFNIGLLSRFMGIYALSDDDFTLTITGGQKIFTDEHGKWTLEKDTLTLKFDDGSTIVLQRRSSG